ncbi:hypothetical protein VOLCADRAFT_87295 [Volvox carteri f. nagariensis]|uniref:Uncharacterized protein n=1 Tax=Volvox carteri f. nagariensis TaxID=3068 RepID=D8TKY8_VOLCA|nr:uncharacterized protein VOLCADRAFT_87295 [Volvox carteri f. nagariensis]EFJ51644.1 hypothetical protein VOLCADRAFT_87295 [Volvox carteri f. nagariensis]|eukprot:XP_002947054.1 hypothetical protein VOLCADRAFT_87295 [Volvox carteri f. nagariensis]
MPAAAAATADRQAAGHHLLDPAIDIPRDRLAKLADELDEPGDRNDRAAARHGRRDRRPKRTACDSSAAVASVSEAGLELPDDTEVKVVFDKLVGNLTKSGKKATARRIVLDAVRVMQKHLRKGDLDNIK